MQNPSLRQICLFILLYLIPYYSSSSDADNKSAEASDKGSEIYRDIIVLPFLLYAPETGLNGGLGAYLVQHDTSNLADYPYPDELEFYASYTENNQFSAKIEPTIFFQGKNRLYGRLDYTYFPDLYWGIGNKTSEENEKAYIRNSASAALAYEKSVLTYNDKELYVGGMMRLSYINTELDSSFVSTFDTEAGLNGSSVASLGFVVRGDFRDNVFAPDSGFYAYSELLYNDDIASDKFNFLSILLDARYYLELMAIDEGQGHVLAMQTQVRMNSSATPFNMMSMLGSDMIMRGYYEGRYRDLMSYALQSEWRFPLFWRLRGALFGSIGHVGESFGDMLSVTPLWAAGIGGRFVWDRESRLSARLDIGFTEEGPGIYLGIKEAF